MNLGSISTLECVNTPPKSETRCDDLAFALAHPDICPQTPRFIVKPGLSLICELASVQMLAFTVENGVETDVTSGTVFTTSNPDVALVGASTGNATGVSAGSATITATYNSQTANAEITVLLGADCCSDRHVAFMVLVDQTRSMQQAFPGYASKLAYAKAAAAALIESSNDSKDVIGLERFTSESAVVLSAPIADKDAVSGLVAGIEQTQDDTEFYDAMSAGIAALNSVTSDLKVLILISDGEDTTSSYALNNNPIQLADDFRAAGGLVIVLGVRAHSSGYNLLSALATGGFFVNAYAGSAIAALDWVKALRGYICGGQCAPEGDVIENQGALGYSGLENWWLVNNFDFATHDYDALTQDAPGAYVDLHGNGFFDYLPENGLYVELMSDAPGALTHNAHMVTKDAISVLDGVDYRISVTLAGNQVQDDPLASVMIQVMKDGTGDVIFAQTVTMEYNAGFQTYGFTYTQHLSMDVKLVIFQYNSNRLSGGSGAYAGNLLKDVTFESLADDGGVLFSDDFNDENETYVPPRCGYGTIPQVVGLESSTLTLTGAGSAGVDGDYSRTNDVRFDQIGGGGFTIQFIAEHSQWELWDPAAVPHTLYQSDDLLTWTLGLGDADPPTGAIVEFSPAYGYLYGYNCYGDGCLDTPPPAQLQDPNPLPNLESGSTQVPGDTVTVSGCARCATDYTNLGQALPATTLEGLPNEKTSIVLTPSNTASKIKAWEIEFRRGWTAVPSGDNPSEDLGGTVIADGIIKSTTLQLDAPSTITSFKVHYNRALTYTETELGCFSVDSAKLEGSNDNDFWEELGGWREQSGLYHTAGTDITVVLPAETAHYLYYKVSYSSCHAVIGAGSGKVFALTVYGPTDEPVGLTLSGSNDNSTWTVLDYHPEVTGGSAGSKLAYQLSEETAAAYKYFRAGFSGGSGSTGNGKVLDLDVFASVNELVCADGTGITYALALQAGQDAAKELLNCKKVYSANESFRATCADGSGERTASAPATSLISEDDAKRKAALAAEVAARLLLRC